MAISKRLRFEIFRRDNHTCRYCGRATPEVSLTVDHVVPEAIGGSDDPSNLVAACSDCNGGKSSIPPDAAVVADVAQDSLRWRKAMEIAHEMASREYDAAEAYCEEFRGFWMDWTWTDRAGAQRHIELPPGWELKVKDLMAAGLSTRDLRDAIDATMSAKYVKDEFAYFLTVARNRLAVRHSVAQELIRRGVV